MPGTMPTRPSRPLLRDVLTFQLKLILDALRDFALSPISLVAASLDALLKRPDEDRLFYRLLRLGRRSEEWIDLWGAARDPNEPQPENVDALLARVEDLVRDPRAGTRKARALKRWLERERRRAKGADVRDAGTPAIGRDDPPPH
jgi:hypothetical protein